MTDESLRTIFDQDADRYHRARPAYPEDLLDALVEAAGLGARSRVLEIGPGTGQATRGLLTRGLTVTAVELGPRLAAVLVRELVGTAVDVVVSAFEDLPVASTYDAVVAFTAWHWLDPALRATKAAALLGPGGALVTVDTHHVAGVDDDVFLELQRCYEQWDPATTRGEVLLPAADVPPGKDEVDGSPLFAAATRLRFGTHVTYTTAEYLDLLLTYSGHRALRADLRDGLLHCVAGVVDGHGGSVTKDYMYELRVTRRTDVAAC
jgi:SAM-dependent methyltransferase